MSKLSLSEQIDRVDARMNLLFGRLLRVSQEMKRLRQTARRLAKRKGQADALAAQEQEQRRERARAKRRRPSPDTDVLNGYPEDNDPAVSNNGGAE